MTRPYGGMTTPSNTLQRTHLMGFRCWFWRESWKWSEILGKQLDYISVWGTRKESSKRYQKRLSLKWHPACPNNSWHRLLSEGLHQLVLFQQIWDIHCANSESIVPAIVSTDIVCRLLQFTTKMIISRKTISNFVTTKMIISPLRPNPRDISCIVSGSPSQFRDPRQLPATRRLLVSRHVQPPWPSVTRKEQLSKIIIPGPWENFSAINHSLLYPLLQGGAPKIAKLVFNSNNYGLYVI